MISSSVILEALTGSRFPGFESEITGATVDSRRATSGSMFVALPGEKVDGHDFIDEAFTHGASIALIQRDPGNRFPVIDLTSEASLTTLEMSQPPYCLKVKDSLAALQSIARFWCRKLNVRTIGITGSVGKSTTKELAAAVLSQRYNTLKNPGNLNNEIGLPLTLFGLNEKHERAVLEMGFYVPGEIALLCDIAQPQVGVITNIGTVHAERAGSREAIARGKSELIQALPPAPQGTAILNFDDIFVQNMAALTKARVFFYGIDPRAHLWADRVESLGMEGIGLRLHYRREALSIRVPLIGRHSVHTVLRAAAIGLIEGLSWQEIIRGIKSGQSQLRLVGVRSQSGALILDDTYNASPESTLAALNLLDELDGRKVAVLGDMLELGIYEQQGHEMVGIRAAQFVDELITVGEKGKIIADSAMDAGLPKDVIHELSDNEAAIAYLQDHLNPQDVVLIKGSHGMRMDLIVAALEAKS